MDRCFSLVGERNRPDQDVSIEIKKSAWQHPESQDAFTSSGLLRFPVVQFQPANATRRSAGREAQLLDQLIQVPRELHHNDVRTDRRKEVKQKDSERDPTSNVHPPDPNFALRRNEVRKQ